MGLTSLCLLQRWDGLFCTSGHCRDHASIAKPWLMFGYFSLTIFIFLFVVKLFNFHKGIYVIKTLCN